jgi:hypothetical protein
VALSFYGIAGRKQCLMAAEKTSPFSLIFFIINPSILLVMGTAKSRRAGSYLVGIIIQTITCHYKGISMH